MDDQSKLFLKRIDDLLATKPSERFDGSAIGKVYIGTLGIATSLYGATSPQVRAIEKRNEDLSSYYPEVREEYFIHELCGTLHTIRDEIMSGLITTLQAETRGEVLADFVVMAKKALGSGLKDAAAVLICAALEDTLKRFAQLNGLVVDDSDMSQVINALKSQGLIKGTQSKVLESFVTVRNKAFHAQCDKIDSAEIHSIIAFVQEFLTQKFSSNLIS